MSTKPLATVEGSGTALALNGIPGALGVPAAERLAANINEAHEKAVAPLLGLLSEARKAMADLAGFHGREGQPPETSTIDREYWLAWRNIGTTIARIDAADPGRWVPEADHKRLQAQMVALEGDVAENPWRGRCEVVKWLLTEHSRPIHIPQILAVLNGDGDDELKWFAAGATTPPSLPR